MVRIEAARDFESCSHFKLDSWPLCHDGKRSKPAAALSLPRKHDRWNGPVIQQPLATSLPASTCEPLLVGQKVVVYDVQNVREDGCTVEEA